MKYIYFIIISLTVLLLLPFILWQLDEQDDLTITILNKTVSGEDVREHLGITWVMNHFQYGEQLDAGSNYYGTHYKDDELVEVPFPTDYSKSDIIYLADSYGVYEDDLHKDKGRLGARSPKIFGGLTMPEWQSISKRLSSEEPSLFIAEFNSFASPTEQPVKNAVTDYLQIDWDGWVGRYFDELAYTDNIEIPQWIVDQFGATWDYEGKGFIFANDYTNEVVVLELGQHVTSKGIQLAFTELGQQMFGLKDSPNYNYWFDVITPKSTTAVLANYDWDLTEEGKSLLAKHGIPEQFAAIVQNDKRTATSYYFAGDFNDIAKVPFFHQVYGLASLNKFAYSFGDSAFYWNTYVPVIDQVIKTFQQKQVEPVKPQQLQQTARIHDQVYEVYRDGKWLPMTIKGVNIGMGKPGVFPGEAAITYDEYYRWLEQIGEMNANTIRVYTLHPPDFYDAVAAYNAQAEQPLYIIHGVWMAEEGMEETLDAYTPALMKEFQQEMRVISDVIHGNAIVEHRPGHASGTYTSNISQYVIGWIIGIEWYPKVVFNMNNELYPNQPQYQGRYFETKDAAAFEIWLAEQMDFLFAYELDTYNSIRPMAFSNWVPTDLLEHPAEPLKDREDLVRIDPNVIYTKNEADLSGQYASYHIYPYYPDFQNNDPYSLSFIDHRGEKNTYAAYLRKLHAAHRIPILVSEFGIPASRGNTHKHVYGFDQGFKSEQEQGELVAKLYEDIMAENMLGGLVFIWQDEWFKRTWNTMGYDNPDRRPYWSNVQTNEQRFGLVAFETNKVLIDGKDEWQVPPIADGLTVDSDEAFLYVKVDTTKDISNVKIVFDTVPEQGLSKVDDLTFTNALEFVATIDRNEEASRFLTNPQYHFFNFENGIYSRNNYAEQEAIDTSVFDKTLLILNRRLDFPALNKSNPPEYYETGKLMEGTSDPEAANYNSLTDYHWTDNMLEVRIPWLLLQARDPSQREFIGNLEEDGLEASVSVDEIYIGVIGYNAKGQVIQTTPTMIDQTVPSLPSYTWEKWDLPASKERLKQSYTILQKLFEEQ